MTGNSPWVSVPIDNIAILSKPAPRPSSPPRSTGNRQRLAATPAVADVSPSLLSSLFPSVSRHYPAPFPSTPPTISPSYFIPSAKIPHQSPKPRARKKKAAIPSGGTLQWRQQRPLPSHPEAEPDHRLLLLPIPIPIPLPFRHRPESRRRALAVAAEP